MYGPTVHDPRMCKRLALRNSSLGTTIGCSLTQTRAGQVNNDLILDVPLGHSPRFLRISTPRPPNFPSNVWAGHRHYLSTAGATLLLIITPGDENWSSRLTNFVLISSAKEQGSLL